MNTLRAPGKWRWLRLLPVILLCCAACNIAVPRATPTPPPPRATRARPQTATQIPSPTAISFVLRDTPAVPTSPPASATPSQPPPTIAPTILAPRASLRAETFATPLPTMPPTVALRVTLAPTRVVGWQLTPDAFTIDAGQLNQRPYRITNRGDIAGGLPGGLPGAPTFVRANPNPDHPVQYAARNALGSLYFIYHDGGSERLTVSPASIHEAHDAASNDAFIADLSWSVDGQRLALIIHSDRSAEDGVWWMQPGRSDPARLLVDCPRATHPGCQIVNRERGPYAWRTRTVQWSPDGRTLLARLQILNPASGAALALLAPGRDYNQAPAILPYAYGTWLADGRLLVSGDGAGGKHSIAILAASGEFLRELYADPALPLAYATEHEDGEIYALGESAGQLALYRLAAGRAQRIGAGRPLPWPDFAHWDLSRGALDLTIDGRVETLYIQPEANGPASTQSEWPVAVAAGALYGPGEQLRVSAVALHLRDTPGLDGEIIATLRQGEFIRILAGPYASGEETWWQAQDAGGRIGWLAGESQGQPLLEREVAG